MPLGGGTFVTQNKVLPGTYQNFISKARAFVNLAARGYVALPIALDWGPDAEVFAVTQEDLQQHSRKIFGYDYNHPKLMGVRDVFKNAHTVYFYKLAVAAVAAQNTYATARYKGSRGNDLTIVVQANVDEPTRFDVSTYLETILVDEQKGIASAAELKDNDLVVFKKEATLAVTAGLSLTTGSNGTELTAGAHQEALNALESYGFNTIGVLSSDPAVKALYVEYVKRMRDEVGAKFQVIGHKLGDVNYEGVIDVQNDTVGDEVYGGVYWVAGAQAGVDVNKSNTNKRYDGEYTIDLTETQTTAQLTALLKNGKYVFHRTGNDVHVLEDVNTLTIFTEEKNEDFSSNQVIRVLDQIAIDTAILFNTRYLGSIQNDESGRVSLWNDLVKHRTELQRIRAIAVYDKKALTIEQGETKKSVVVNELIEPTVAMSQLYIATVVA